MDTVKDIEYYKWILGPYAEEMGIRGQLVIDQLYRSPILRPGGRKDRDRSFKLYGQTVADGSEVLYWRDFGRDDLHQEYGYRYWHLAMILWGIPHTPENYGRTMYRIKTQFNPNLEMDVGERVDFTSHAKIGALREYEIDWWNQYGVSHNTLRKYDVYSLLALFINGELAYGSFEEEPCFCYVFDKDANSWQVYRPSPKKFYTQNIRHQLMGYAQLPWRGKNLFIMSGFKDGLVAAELGYPFVAGSGENVERNLLEHLPMLRRRFENIYSLYDNDSTGHRVSALLHSEYGIEPFPFDYPFGMKDVAKTSKCWGIDYVGYLFRLGLGQVQMKKGPECSEPSKDAQSLQKLTNASVMYAA